MATAETLSAIVAPALARSPFEFFIAQDGGRIFFSGMDPTVVGLFWWPQVASAAAAALVAAGHAVTRRSGGSSDTEVWTLA